MRTPNGKYTGVVGEVLDFDPPHRFSHTFQFTHLDDPPSTVIYELREIPEGTEFTLTTENVPQGTKSEKSMAQGGPFITKTLKSLVETGKPHFGARMILILIKFTGFMSPKRCRSENWPLTR
ncbi:MAG: SRPBCC domain-containing protein [Pirellulales bacterium]|nr:SRPBCC domain-containing protein [Pirellulales bacterium]